MKLVQMFFEWLKPEPQATARGPLDFRPQDARANSIPAHPPALSPALPPALLPALLPAPPSVRTPTPARPRPDVPAKRPTKQDLYDAMVREMCLRYQVRVRKWRTSMSGIAWYVEYRDGRIQRLIESPRPKSPMSAAIFLHEIGHHHIGLGIHKPRCLEEYLAWQYSLEQMEAWNIEITQRVRIRVAKSLRYAVRKAQRRGIQRLPQELLAYAA